jgi:NADH:ubiquinone oxidoreductase subunit E
MNSDPLIDIELCLGSACFVRGNKTAIEALTRFIQSGNLGDKVRIRGALCENKCKEGPHAKINGTLHTCVDGPGLVETIRHMVARTDA